MLWDLSNSRWAKESDWIIDKDRTSLLNRGGPFPPSGPHMAHLLLAEWLSLLFWLKKDGVSWWDIMIKSSVLDRSLFKRNRLDKEALLSFLFDKSYTILCDELHSIQEKKKERQEMEDHEQKK
jgi:hypothetical protein